ncbi:condensation domain-containing protein, partial [Bacillus altitudinis]|uniref:condensation domain-containing protein n=1 Tax=Bacillus altitudinis TaxID=293387 RepID=UPI003B5249DE
MQPQPPHIHQLINHFIPPFHLQKPPLLTLPLLSQSHTLHYLFIHIHHIISHPASLPILIHHLSTFYPRHQLHQFPIQYNHYPLSSNTPTNINYYFLIHITNHT